METREYTTSESSWPSLIQSFMAKYRLTHHRLNKLSKTTYWKSPNDLRLHCFSMSFLGLSKLQWIKRIIFMPSSRAIRVALFLEDRDNSLYTYTRYKDKIRYSDNLNVKKASLKRWQLMRNYAKTLHKISSTIRFGYLLGSPQRF